MKRLALFITSVLPLVGIHPSVQASDAEASITIDVESPFDGAKFENGILNVSLPSKSLVTITLK